MSATYRAIRLERFADSFRAGTEIVELPLADPAPGELRVRNRWCGVNGIFDTQMARDAVDYIRFKVPTLTGVESVGMVEAVGNGVTGFAVGDAVASFRFRSGYREVNIAPATEFEHVPDASRESLALASSGVAALLALEHAGQLRDGETVAISAAAGGLGHLMVQIAKARGCRVVAVCGGADKAALVRGLGADRVIDHRAEDVAAVLAAEFRDALDVAVDTVGGRVFDAFLDNLAPDGRLVVSGAASDMDGTPQPSGRPRLPLGFYYKSASIRAFQNGRVQHLWPDGRARVFALAAEGKLKPAFDPVPYAGLEAAADAVEALLAGRTVGKVALRL
jgi:hypothetical protein